MTVRSVSAGWLAGWLRRNFSAQDAEREPFVTWKKERKKKKTIGTGAGFSLIWLLLYCPRARARTNPPIGGESNHRPSR